MEVSHKINLQEMTVDDILAVKAILLSLLSSCRNSTLDKIKENCAKVINERFVVKSTKYYNFILARLICF